MDTTTLDTYEQLCDFARAHSEQLDTLRWLIGDTANVVMERYSEKTVDDFARDIGQRRSTVYQYSAVSRFYPPSLRRRLLDDMPTLNYSHMRDAMRLKDITAAVTWLNEVATNSYTADEASHKLTERMGRETRDSVEGFILDRIYIDGKMCVAIWVNEELIAGLIDKHVTIRQK